MNRREAGLRGVLVRSHLGVAGLGVLALVLTLMAITLLRARTSRLARESGPAAVAALETQEGLMESLAALRGWMSIDDPAFLEARTQAWDGVVWPAFQTLKQQAGDDGRLDALRNDLRDLEEWQWHIEQVAQSEGNEPARRRLLVQIDPVVSHVLSATTALMALEADGDQRYTHLQVLADLRAAVATSRSALGDFVIVGDQSMRLDFERLLAEATSLALVVAREGGASTAHADQLALLDQEFRAYAALSESVVRLRASSGWNVAHELLRTEAAPLAERAARLAGAIVDDHRAAMRRDAGYVDRVATAVMIAVVALLIGLVLVASWLAVRRAGAIAGPIKVLAEASVGLAEGRVAEDLPVTTRDEVGALTKTFNEMRRTLVERDQALRAHQAELTDTNAALEAQNRIQTAVNQLDDLMRGDQEVETLGDNVLGFLASWFDADVGAMYLPTGETLEYVAGYAFAPDEAARSIPVNAGLPGQAARRKTPILIETPAGHLPLSSATGQSETAHLLVVPIVNEDELFGVVELGSFAPIDSERMELLRIVMPSIAIHVRAAESRARLRELLDTTREQADALEAKQEALQAANEELRVQQEELRQSNEATVSANPSAGCRRSRRNCARATRNCSIRSARSNTRPPSCSSKTGSCRPPSRNFTIGPPTSRWPVGTRASFSPTCRTNSARR